MSGVLIVEARFYPDISDALAQGAIAALEESGVAYERVSVPGALEIPAAIALAAHRSDGPPFDGFVALGCVIRGETTHYETVCAESARGLQDLALRERLPIGNGILTVENDEQAWARASAENNRNKGRDAAEACLSLMRLKSRFEVR